MPPFTYLQHTKEDLLCPEQDAKADNGALTAFKVGCLDSSAVESALP